MTKFAIGLALAAFTLMTTRTSVAQESVEPEPVGEPDVMAGTTPAKPISAALLLGFGADIGEDGNPYGFGVGVRGGYNLDRLYLGGVLVFHLGSSDEVTSDGFSIIEVDYSLWLLGAEAGYDFQLMDRLVVRPSAILGVSNVSASSDAALFGRSVSGTDTKLLLSLGASALYDLTPDIFVGGDLRFPLALGGDSFLGFAIYATGGVRF